MAAENIENTASINWWTVNIVEVWSLGVACFLYVEYAVLSFDLLSSVWGMQNCQTVIELFFVQASVL